jgi:glycosyltransferase involved in cell wall biosynthesis
VNILNVAYPLAPVGPDAVGGAEQILTQLDAALVASGHKSIVVACEGSRTRGILVPTRRSPGAFDDHRRDNAIKANAAAIRYGLERWPLDLIHFHGLDFHEYLPDSEVPVLATLHLPPEWYPRTVFNLRRPLTFLNCVSAAQQRSCPPCDYLLGVVANGVNLSSGPHARRNYALALGRICPEKGFHFALRAAAAARTPLLLAGEVFPYPCHENYFRREIRPLLGHGRHFIGSVGLKRKRRLLCGARCLLVPSLAPETSSLVAMEALSCGTPVVAFPSGALPEIIEHGKTGFLVKTEREMADAIHQSSNLSAEVCRETARQRFSSERMILNYFELYERVSTRRQTSLYPQSSPSIRVDRDTLALLGE